MAFSIRIALRTHSIELGWCEQFESAENPLAVIVSRRGSSVWIALLHVPEMVVAGHGNWIAVPHRRCVSIGLAR